MLIEWLLCDYPEFDALPQEMRRKIIKAYSKNAWKQYHTWKYLVIMIIVEFLYFAIIKEIDPIYHWLINQYNGFVSFFLVEFYIILPLILFFYFLYIRNMYKYIGRHIDIIIQGPLTDPAIFTRID